MTFAFAAHQHVGSTCDEIVLVLHDDIAPTAGRLTLAIADLLDAHARRDDA